MATNKKALMKGKEWKGVFFSVSVYLLCVKRNDHALYMRAPKRTDETTFKVLLN